MYVMPDEPALFQEIFSLNYFCPDFVEFAIIALMYSMLKKEREREMASLRIIAILF